MGSELNFIIYLSNLSNYLSIWSNLSIYLSYLSIYLSIYDLSIYLHLSIVLSDTSIYLSNNSISVSTRMPSASIYSLSIYLSRKYLLLSSALLCAYGVSARKAMLSIYLLIYTFYLLASILGLSIYLIWSIYLDLQGCYPIYEFAESIISWQIWRWINFCMGCALNLFIYLGLFI